MGISGINTTLRYLLMFLCLATFGFDMFFVYVDHENYNVVLRWKFFTQTSVVGSLFLIILLSELFYRIEIHSRRRRQYEYDYEGHSPYLPSHQQYSADTSPSGTNPKSSAHTTIIPADHKVPSHQRTFWSIMRFLTVWAISASLLNLSITSFHNQDRAVFALPFNRDVLDDQEDKIDSYDPHDLFSCKDIDVSDLTTMLCQFNQLTMILSALIALITIVEGLLTIIIENRAHTSTSMYPSNKFMMKKRAEYYDEAELGNAQVVVPMSPRPLSEPSPYGVYNQNASLPNPGQFELDERPLPDLPDRKENLPEPEYSSNTNNPFSNDLKDSKNVWANSEGNTYTQDTAESSGAFSKDVKRKDGL